MNYWWPPVNFFFTDNEQRGKKILCDRNANQEKWEEIFLAVNVVWLCVDVQCVMWEETEGIKKLKIKLTVLRRENIIFSDAMKVDNCKISM